MTQQVTHSILSWLVAMMFDLGLLSFTAFLQFIKTTHGLRHWVCGNRSDAKIFCWRQGKQEQLTVPSLSWSTQSSRSIFEIGILFYMSRTSNIANLQNKWLQEFLDIHFPEAGIIRGRDHWAQHVFWLPGTPQTSLLNCPIDLLTHLVWKCSRFGGHVMRNPLVSNHHLSIRMGAHFVLVPPWFSRCQKHSPRSGKSINLLLPYLTSQDPVLTPNVSSTRARVAAADTILPPAITSGASDAADGWQCDPWFETQVKTVAEEFAVQNVMD